MRKQKKKNRYEKKNVSREIQKDSAVTTESVVKKTVDVPSTDTVTDNYDVDTDIGTADNGKFGIEVSRVAVATVIAAVIFGIVGYLSAKTDVINNISEQLLQWFNLA